MTFRAFTIGFAGLGLVACGGGSGGGGGVPTGATPPQQVQTNSTLTNMTTDQSFNTASATISGHYSSFSGFPSATQFRAIRGGNRRSSMTYDQIARTDIRSQSMRAAFQVTRPSRQATSTPTNTDLRRSGPTSTPRRMAKPDFLLFIPGNSIKDLSYVTYGVWQRITLAGLRWRFRDIPSLSAAFPRSAGEHADDRQRDILRIDRRRVDQISLGLSEPRRARQTSTPDFATGGVDRKRSAWSSRGVRQHA